MSQLTQSEINDLLQQFIGQYAGQRPDYYGYAGECLSLAKRWFDVLKNGHLNGQMLAPPSANWGSDYWVSPPGSVLELFDRQNYDPNAQYPQGSLFVNTGSHHIGIMLSNNPGSTTATVFEQNADPDGSAAHTAQRAKNRIDGILVIKAYVAPAPPPAPVRTPKDYMQYSAVPAKTMRAAKLQTNWYNLSNDSDNIDNFQVAQTLTVNTPFPIGGYAKNMHFPMYTYAMTAEDFNRAVNGDYSTNNGINLNDLEDIPYTPPAAPLPVPKVDYYELKTTVVYFATATDAQKDQNGIGPLNKGTYVLLKSDGNARQVTKNNADTVSYWINDLDNKIEQPVIIAAPAVVQPTLPVDAPTPVTELVNDTSVTAAPPVVPVVPVKPKQPLQWGWINENHQPSIFQNVSRNDVLVNDLEGSNPPLKLPAGAKKICSRYTKVDGVSYVLPDKEFTNGLGYGIEETQAIMEIRKPTILTEVFSDILNFGGYLETGFKSTARLITDVSPVKISHATQRGKQFLDGINAGKRK